MDIRWYAIKLVSTDEVCTYLYPMTHKEACTFISKHSNPTRFMLHEIDEDDLHLYKERPSEVKIQAVVDKFNAGVARRKERSCE